MKLFLSQTSQPKFVSLSHNCQSLHASPLNEARLHLLTPSHESRAKFTCLALLASQSKRTCLEITSAKFSSQLVVRLTVFVSL